MLNYNNLYYFFCKEAIIEWVSFEESDAKEMMGDGIVE